MDSWLTVSMKNHTQNNLPTTEDYSLTYVHRQMIDREHEKYKES